MLRFVRPKENEPIHLRHPVVGERRDRSGYTGINVLQQTRPRLGSIRAPNLSSMDSIIRLEVSQPAGCEERSWIGGQGSWPDILQKPVSGDGSIGAPQFAAVIGVTATKQPAVSGSGKLKRTANWPTSWQGQKARYHGEFGRLARRP